MCRHQRKGFFGCLFEEKLQISPCQPGMRQGQWDAGASSHGTGELAGFAHTSMLWGVWAADLALPGWGRLNYYQSPSFVALVLGQPGCALFCSAFPKLLH